MNNHLKLSDFDYYLPKELIAQHPLKERDASRLLVVNRAQKTIEHHAFRQVTNYFSRGDLLVLNDTKVLPSRLKAKRATGGKVEILLLNRVFGLTFKVLVKPARIRINEEIIFDDPNISARMTAQNEVTFTAKDVDAVYSLGRMPIPPYIKREPDDLDAQYYQTVYARKAGAVAAPTAGLHFSKELLRDINSNDVNIAYLTLHVGFATFRPVKTEDITKHQMDFESFEIGSDSLRLIEETRLKGNRIFAVGTTSTRALETYALGSQAGKTNLFIYPGYNFKIVDSLITNFHLPKTTLFMLVCAFAGKELIQRAYEEAVKAKYRFYSYGDAMLII